MKYLPASLCCLLLIASGVAAGLYTNRWASPADFGPIQARMDAVPTSLGTWVSRPAPSDQEALDRAGIRAHLSREYRDTRTGRTITVLLVAGKPGPIAVHTPDVCFQGAGYEQSNDQSSVDVGPAGARFWNATFVKPGAAVQSRECVFWGWNAGDGWEAPEHRTVRMKFALRPTLYKMYLVTDSPPPGKTSTELWGDFADRLFPELDRAIVPPPVTETGGTT